MLTAMTEILCTVRPSVHAKRVTMHQKLDVSLSSGGKGKRRAYSTRKS